MRLGIWSTQSASSATSAATSSVATTPPRDAPTNSPASFPTFSGLYTRSPTTSSSGCSRAIASDRSPMLPVAHWMTRYVTGAPLNVGWYRTRVLTLSDVLRDRAARDGDRVALDFEEHSFTFGELQARAEVWASRLARAGATHGTRV